MKIIIETQDIANAKFEHLASILASMQAIAMDARENEIPAEVQQEAVTEKAEPVKESKKEAPKQEPEPVKAEPKQEKPAKAETVKKAEPKQEPKQEKPVKEAPKAGEPVKAEPDKKEAPKKEEKKPEPAKVETPKEEEKPVTREMVLTTFKTLAKTKGSKVCKELLNSHGYAKLSEIPEDELGTILKEAEAL